MRLKFAIVALALATASQVAAAPSGSSDPYKVATSLALVIHAGDACGFDVNPDAVTAYLRERSLLTPEVMSTMENAIGAQRAFGDPVTKTQCAIGLEVAREAGFLAQ